MIGPRCLLSAALRHYDPRSWEPRGQVARALGLRPGHPHYYDPRPVLLAAQAAGCRTIGGACRWLAAPTIASETRQAPVQDGRRADEAEQRDNTACAEPGNREPEPTAACRAGEGDAGPKKPTADPEGGPDRTDAAEPSEGAAATETIAGDQPDRDGRVAPKSGEMTDSGTSDAIGAGEEGGDTTPGNSDAEQSALDSAPENANNSGLPKGNGDASASVSSAPGGWYASAEAASRRALSLSGPAKEVARSLRRLVKSEQVGLGEEPSPRISARRLVRELASRSYRLGRAHREELEPGRIIIAPDVSGSCSACAPDTLAAALAIAREMPDVVEVVPHSNGFRRDNQPWKWEGVRLLLVLGDWDGGDVYREAADAGVAVVWLDSYGKVGGPRRSMDGARGAFRRWRNKPLKYDGIGDAHTAAIALRDAVRSRR